MQISLKSTCADLIYSPANVYSEMVECIQRFFLHIHKLKSPASEICYKAFNGDLKLLKQATSVYFST